MEALKKFDLHPKTRSEFKTRTISGALASVWAVVSITYLVLAELRYSRQVRVVDRLWVNSTHGAGVNVSFDLEFPHPIIFVYLYLCLSLYIYKYPLCVLLDPLLVGPVLGPYVFPYSRYLFFHPRLGSAAI